MLLYLPAWVNGLSGISQVDGGDIAISVWSLRWAAYAVTHGLNPFYSDRLNVPGGINMLQNTTCLLLGVVVTPVTLALGPVASLNLLMTLSFATSAAAAYLLLRRWISWAPAAFVGGLVYGFSPYMVSAGWTHLHALFLPLPPLIVLCVDDLVVRQKGSAVRRGILLALLICAQFFVSLEILANTAELCLVGVVVLGLLHREQVGSRFRHAALGLITAGGASAVLLAYPLWFGLLGPEHGRIFVPRILFSIYGADLLGPIVPTSNQLLTTPALSSLGDQFSGGLIRFGDVGRMVTSGAYLGLPLLLLLAFIAIRYRKLAIVRFFTILTLVAFVASLGPLLKVHGDITNIKMPERVLIHLPLLDATYPYRYGPFVALGAAVLFALGLDQLARRPPGGVNATPRWPALLSTQLGLLLLMIFTLAPLVPAQPYVMVKLSTPHYFLSSAVDAIAPDSVVLTYPPPTPFTSKTMIWQASAGLRFRMVGAYMFAQDGSGKFTLTPNHGITETALFGIWTGKPTITLSSEEINNSLLSDLKAWHVSTVLVGVNEPHASEAVALFTTVLGRSPTYQQDVAAWYGLGY